MKYFISCIITALLANSTVYTFSDKEERVTFCSISNPTFEDRSIGFHEEVASNPASKVQFIFGSDRYECLEKLLRHEADFGVFLGEDLTLIPLINASASNSLLVTHEFRQQWNRTYKFDMVAMKSNNGSNDSNSLRNVSLCHPGSNEHGWLFDFSDVLLQFFANIENNSSARNSDLTNYENKLRSLNSFLGPSCIPGPWSPSPYVDRILKTRYSNLCKLCQNKSNSCSVNDTFWGRDGSLACFSSCTGNVLWFHHQHLDSAVRHLPPQAKCQPTKEWPFICPPWDPAYTSERPCTWISRPWPVIVSQNSSAGSVAKLIMRINSSEVEHNETKWRSALRKILLSSSKDPIFVEWLLPPEKYLNEVRGFMKAKIVAKYNASNFAIKICVNDNYLFTRCNFMARIAKVYSIDPKIECYLEQRCLSRVFKSQYEAFLTYGEELIRIFRLKFFKIILHQKEDDLFKYRYSHAVVRKESAVKTFSDLKGLRACLTRRNGLAWNSLLINLIENSLIPSYCYGSQVLVDFFDDICVTDRKDTWISHCFNDEKNSYNTKRRREEAEALRCLAENRGDVAFFDYKWIGRYLDTNRNQTWASNLVSQDFRILCTSTFDNKSSEPCYLSKESTRKIFVLNHISSRREEKVIFAILIASSFLSIKNVIFNIDFRMFKLPKFNGRERLIVHEVDGAVDFQAFDEYEKSMGKFGSYETRLKKMLDICPLDRKPNLRSKTTVIIYVTILLFILFLLVSVIVVSKIW